MLLNKVDQFDSASFTDEGEIERVVQDFAEELFGSSIVYLPQARIATLGGRGTVPDAIVIDFEAEEWYVVEAERAIHGTWEHIAPQVSRQLAAVGSSVTQERLVQLTLAQVRQSGSLQAMLSDLGIEPLAVHGRVQAILLKRPTIAIPIDGIPKDLKEWAQTLRNDVKIWHIEKYVSRTDASRILYSIPDDTRPTLSTTAAEPGTLSAVRSSSSQPFQELLAARPSLLGEAVHMDYGPRGGQKQHFTGVIRQDGIEVDGVIYSPSYAAVQCIRQTGSLRTTANGWLYWKTSDGQLLDELYSQVRASTEADGIHDAG
jgi:hypothetical protein